MNTEQYLTIFKKALIGLEYELAKQFLSTYTKDIYHRLVSVDGNGMIVTCDYVPYRLNISIVDGHVVNVNLG